MECNPEMVSAFLDDELDDQTRRSLAEHLLECERCCVLLAKLSALRAALFDRFILPDPEAMTRSIMARITGASMDEIVSDSSDKLEGALSSRLARFGAPAVLALALAAGWAALDLRADANALAQPTSASAQQR
ncbi:anti-sigma factor family protein [Magnetofaba australis]|nr:zf-HC2 domain-containing protein [Magnetofaba australis]